MGTPITLTRAEVPIGDHTGRKQMIFRVAAETTSDKPGLIVYEAVSNSGVITRYYTWFDSDGVFRYHTSAPADQDSDGSTILAVTAGNTDIDGPVTLGSTLKLDGTPDECTAVDSALSVTTSVSNLDTSIGACAGMTLADGTQGQIKFITMTVDAGDATVTPANPLGFSTIKFTAIGQTAMLVFLASKWRLIHAYGATVA